MHWQVDLQNRIDSSIFTREGVIDASKIAIRRFDSSLFVEPGWRFHKGVGAGWSDAYPSKAHARAELGAYLLKEEDRLVRAVGGIAGFSHSGWMVPIDLNLSFKDMKGLWWVCPAWPATISMSSVTTTAS